MPVCLFLDRFRMGKQTFWPFRIFLNWVFSVYMACRVFAVLNSFWCIGNPPKIFFLFWTDFPVKTRFKFPAGATPFKIGRVIKSKRALGLAGRDVISGKKNFYNSLNKRRFVFRKDVEVDFFLGKHANTQ